MRTTYSTGQETVTRNANTANAQAKRIPIHGIYNTYYRIRGLLVPISEAPAADE